MQKIDIHSTGLRRYLLKLDLEDEGAVFTKDFIVNDQFLPAPFDPKKESGVHIQALKDSVLLESKYSGARLVFKKYPDLGTMAQRGMEKRLESLYDRLESFARMQAKDRYHVFRQGVWSGGIPCIVRQLKRLFDSLIRIWGLCGQRH